MPWKEAAHSLLKEVEQKVAVLGSGQLQAGDYEGATALTRIAGDIHRLAASIRHEVPAGGPEPSSAHRFAMSQSRLDAPAFEAATATRTAAKGSASGKPKYPRYRRDGDELVKIGHSKSSKSESKTYEHRSPPGVAKALVRKIRGLATDPNQTFTSDDIKPLTADDGSEVPDYQVYLCLAWLVIEGLVVKRGRQGYTVPSPASLDADLSRIWDALPRR